MYNKKSKKYRWKQKEFVISTFHGVSSNDEDSTERVLRNTKEAGFNYVELTFNSRAIISKALSVCDNMGLKVIVEDLDHFSGFQNKIIPSGTEDSVIEAIQFYKKHSSLAGYYIWDEPFMEQLELAGEIVKLFKKHDAEHLLHVAALQSYSPDYWWSNGLYKEYVDSFVDLIDPPILSFDYYVFSEDIDKGINIENSNIWKDLGYMRKISLERDIPFWFYIQLIGDIIHSTPGNMNIDKLKFQIFSSLAYGVKGISYYNTIGGMMDCYGNTNHLYEGVKSLNLQLKVLGEVLLNLKSTAVYNIGIADNSFINDISESYYIKQATKGLIIGEFSGNDNKKYILFSNCSFEKGYKSDIVLKKKFDIYLIDKNTSKEVLIGNNIEVFSLHLSAGEGDLYAICNETIT